MASETLTIDPSGTSLALWNSTKGIKVIEQSYPAPEHKIEYASSVDTEGALPASDHYENREIEVKLMVSAGSTTFKSNLKKLQQKVGKIQREGGVLRRVTPASLTIDFDLTNAQIDIPADWQFIQKSHAEVGLKFEADWKSVV